MDGRREVPRGGEQGDNEGEPLRPQHENNNGPQPEPPGIGKPRGPGNGQGLRNDRRRRGEAPVRPFPGDSRADTRRLGLHGTGNKRRNPEPVHASGLPHRGDDTHNHQQPARLHHHAPRQQKHPLRERPGQGIRGAGRPRERRRPDSLHGGDKARLRLHEQVRKTLSHRPRRLQKTRAQRGGRTGLHPAHDVQEDRRSSDGGENLGAAARGKRRDHRKAGGGALGKAERGAGSGIRVHRPRRASRGSHAGLPGAAGGEKGRDEGGRGDSAGTQRGPSAGAGRVPRESQDREDKGQEGRSSGRPRREDRGLGHGRGARLRVHSRAGNSHKAHGTGQREGNLQPPPRGAPRPRNGKGSRSPAGDLPGGGVVRGEKQSAQRKRLPGLRVRVQHAEKKLPGDMGSAVRGLHKRGADDSGRIPRLGQSQVGTAPVPGPASAPRLRGTGAGPLERETRKIPDVGGRIQHAGGELHDFRAAFPRAETPGPAA